MAQHHHALNLPEVLFRIGRHLESSDDVVACLLVCKSFRASFEPYLWMNVHLGPAGATKRELSRQEPLAKFISLRYSRFRIGVAKEEIQRRDRIVHGLQRIAPWIRSLAVHAHVFPDQLRVGNRCTGISTLLIVGVPLNEQFDETYWNDCEALLRQNSACLRSLTLWSWGKLDRDHRQGQPLWKVFMTCSQLSNLTTLRIQTYRMSQRDLEALWEVCGQLEILELTNLEREEGIQTLLRRIISNQVGHELTFEGQVSTSAVAYNVTNETSSTAAIPSATTVRLPKLRELTLDRVDMSSEHQLEQIILHCPLLQILFWRAELSEPSIRRFCDYFAASTWLHLDWIEIRSDDKRASDQEHASLLQSAPRPFRRLDVDVESLQQQTFNLYREHGHFTTLTKIDLTPSSFLTLPFPRGPEILALVSKQVQEVLESCPLLEHIVALMITAQDIIHGQPWVCHRLEKFQVMVNMQFSDSTYDQRGKRRQFKYSKDDKILCHQIFERLGQLRQLTELNMVLLWKRWIRLSRTNPSSLPMRRRMGLGYLSTLKNLEVFGYHGSQEFRVGDVEWMLQHWKKLRKITGNPLKVKWSMTLEGTPDERSNSVMEALKTRHVQLAPAVTKLRRFKTSEEFGTFNDSESWSESERESESESEGEGEEV